MLMGAFIGLAPLAESLYAGYALFRFYDGESAVAKWSGALLAGIFHLGFASIANPNVSAELV